MATLAAEFPNDNPDLHGGVVWVCLDVVGPPVAERQRPAAVAEPEPLPEILPEILPEPEPVAEAEPEPEPEPQAPPPRPSGIFAIGDAPFEIEQLADDEIVVEEMTPLDGEVIEVVGAGAELVTEPEPVAEPEPAVRAQTELPAPPDDPFTVFVAALTDVALAHGSPLAASRIGPLLEGGAEADDALGPGFATTASAWRGILRGTSEDWGAISGAMLDDWAAEVLAKLLDAPDRVQILKRDLRARGVAAFGLIEAA